MEFGATREMFLTPCRIRHKSLLSLKSGKGAHLSGAKGPGQVIPDAINPPKVSPVEDLFGQTFESIPLSHLPNWKTGSLEGK